MYLADQTKNEIGNMERAEPKFDWTFVEKQPDEGQKAAKSDGSKFGFC